MFQIMQSASQQHFGCEFCTALDYESATEKSERDVPWLTAFAADGGDVVVSGGRVA